MTSENTNVATEAEALATEGAAPENHIDTATEAEAREASAAHDVEGIEFTGSVDFSTEGMTEADAKAYADFMEACKIQGRPRSRMIPVSEIYSEGNPRVNLNIKPIVISILREGFRENEPLMLVQTAENRYLVVRGNRRFFSLEWLRRNRPEDFAKKVPGGKVPAIVYTGLTGPQIEALRQDFDTKAGKQALSQWETFLNVRNLVRAGFLSESAIAAQAGLYKEENGKLVGNRSLVQPLVNLASLPQDVQNLFRPVLDRPEGWSDKTGLRKKHIMQLAKTYRDEKGDTPAFREALAEASKLKEHGNKKTEGAADDPVPKYGQTVKSLLDRVNSFRSPTLQGIIDRIGKGESLAEIDDILAIFDSVKGSPEYAALASAVTAADSPADDSALLEGADV